jgi:hypothetical protein
VQYRFGLCSTGETKVFHHYYSNEFGNLQMGNLLYEYSNSVPSQSDNFLILPSYYTCDSHIAQPIARNCNFNLPLAAIGIFDSDIVLK